MSDLKERLRDLDRIRVPRLDDELARPRLARRRERSFKRVLTAGLALLVAATGFVFAARAFRAGPTAPATTVANGPIAFVGTVDSEDYLYGEQTELFMINPDGSGERRLTDDPSAFDSQPAWSPDGSRIVFAKGGEIAERSGLFVMEADGSGVTLLVEDETGADSPAWSPDGTSIAFDSGRGHEETGTGSRDIFIVDAGGHGSPVRVTMDPAMEVQPAWSPDSSQIAFARYEGDTTDLYVLDVAGGATRQLTDGDAADFRPAWSPNGKRLAFERDGDIYVIDADGSDIRRLTDDPAFDGEPAWSPDGTKIAFSSDRDGDFDVYVMSIDGSGATQVTRNSRADTEPTWGQAAASTDAPIPAVAGMESIRVGEDVRSVAYGEGSAWVAVSNNDGSFAGRILRIDPDSDAIEANIPVDVIPTWEVGGGAMVVADGSVWITGGLEQPGDFDDPGGGADAAAIRIDAASEQVVQTIELGGVVGADLAFLDGDLWVLLFGDETVNHSMEVVRVDPASGEILARIPLSAGWAHSIVPAAGRLVLIEGGEGDAVNVGGHMTSIDPTTNEVGARTAIESDFSAHGPVAWREQVWAFVADGFARFDPISAEIVERSPALGLADCCGFLEADDRGIWFLGVEERTGATERRLALFDPETGQVHELVSLGGDESPVAMAVAPDSVWILNYEGTLTHVALS